MPRKTREIIRDYERAGFAYSGSKGSHRKYKHPSGVTAIVSGGLGDDADRYMEKQLAQKLREVKNNEK